MINRANYLHQQAYLAFLANVRHRTPDTVRKTKTLTNYFLIWLDEIPIRECSKISKGFPQFLETYRKKQDGATTSLHPNTQKKIIQTVKRFLRFLKLSEPHEFKELPLFWIEALSPAQCYALPAEHVFVTFDEIVQLVSMKIPSDDVRLRREQAAAAMLFASGMRSSAFGSLPIEAVDLEKMEIRQWPSLGVRTKNGKHATTYLLDIPELIDVIREWDSLIREQLPPEAMWYAPFRTDHFGNKTKLSSASAGKNRNQAIAKGLRKLYRAANLPYKSPHKFRHGHAVHALLGARTMAAYKAVSQNLMHGSIKVTDEVYAWLNEDDVRTQISSLAVGQSQSLNPDDELRNYLNSLSKHDLEKAINHAARLLANG